VVSCAGAITYGLLSILLITPLVGLLAVQLPLQVCGIAFTAVIVMSIGDVILA
jgi:hypothetical protein